MNKIKTNYYEKYVGCFAKRFYNPFNKDCIFPIIGFKFKYGYAHFEMKDDEGNEWEWDVEDCVIITNETPMIEDERVANISNPKYNGCNPYTGEQIVSQLPK